MEKSFYFIIIINNIRIILFCIMMAISYEYIFEPVEGRYPKLKKLPSGEYLVIMNKGIYIFNKNFTNNTQLYMFIGNEIIYDEIDFNKTEITEIKNQTNYYILSLIKERLYLYNHIDRTINKSDLSSYLSGGSKYNLLPYKVINSNLYYIIIFSKENSENCGRSSYILYKLKFFLFEINISLNKTLSYKNTEFINNNNECKTYITNINFSCHLLNQTYIICLYLIDNSQTIEISKFNIENNFSREYIYSYINKKINKIMAIKSSISPEYHNIFFCYYWEYLTYQGFVILKKKYLLYNVCLVYNIIEKKIEVIYQDIYNTQNLEIYDFDETNSKILIFNDIYKTYLIIVKIDLKTFSEESYDNYFSKCSTINSFELNYNDNINEYDLIMNCYYNYYGKWYIIYNISLFSLNESSNFTFKEEELPTAEFFEIEEEYYFMSENEGENLEGSNLCDNEEEKTENNLKEYEPIEEEEEFDLNEIQKKEITEEEEKEVKELEKLKIKGIIHVETTEKPKIIDLDITKEELMENITNVINSIEIGKNYEFTGEDFNLVIKPTNSSYLETQTHVNFSQCEKTLREKLNISSSRILTFFQIEIDNKDEKSLVNNVQYQVYDDNKTLLDLSLCKDSKIQIFHSIKDTSLIDINSISSFKDLGIDIFNINDSFFYDICHPYSDSKNDVILKDRIKDIYQNYSLCEDECTYNEINTEYMTISCVCDIKTYITTNDSSRNLEKIDDIELESNFGIIKCFNLVFSFDGKLKNIGFWIFLFLVI